VFELVVVGRRSPDDAFRRNLVSRQKVSRKHDSTFLSVVRN
jgi:hypothetical protein